MTMSAPSTEELLGLLKEKPAGDGPMRTENAEALRREYLRRAAVLHVFDLAKLRLDKGVDEAGAAAWLIDDTIPALGWAGTGKRTLRLEARREGLRLLGDRAALQAAIARVPDREHTDLQRLFEMWLAAGTLALGELTAKDLNAVLTLCDWGLTDYPEFPPRVDVEAAARLRTLTADFETLAAQFVGRSAELATLHDFLGLTPAAPTRWLPKFLTRQQSSSVMALYGIGGVGKTALVGHFVLDFFDSIEGSDFPFVYLAFDDRGLDPAEPATIIGAILRQLNTQISSWLADTNPPENASTNSRRWGYLAAVVEARNDIRGTLEAYVSGRERLAGRAVAHASQHSRISSLRLADDKMFEAFAHFMNAVSLVGAGPESTPLPLLIILDSFEEVEYLPQSDLALFWSLISLLEARVPNMRLLIVGRVPPISIVPTALRAQHLALGDLTAADAHLLLARLGVGPDGAQEIVQHIGCNPLTLHLAARAVAAAEGTDVLGSVQTRRWGGLVSASQEVIRGQLYQRILDHIHDPEVRQLAHPGMVLRRITPDLIVKVLGPTCDLKDMTPEQAVADFDALGREHSLVRLDPAGALIYREELRKPILRVMTADRPEKASALHLAAAEYYDGRTDPIEQIEFIYHMLMLPNPDYALIEPLWTAATGQRLAGAVDEIPVENRPWLASRMRIRLTGEEARYASEEDQVRILWQEAVRVFRLGDFEQANALLTGQMLTPDSPLTVLRVRALLALGRVEEARHIVVRATLDYPVDGEKGPLAELRWLLAQAHLIAGNRAGAERALVELLPIAESFDSALPIVQALAELVSIAAPDRVETYRETLAERLMQLVNFDLYSEPSLVRLALVRLGPVYPQIWLRLLPDAASGLPENLAGQPRETLEMLGTALVALLVFHGPGLSALMTEALSSQTGFASALSDMCYALIKALREVRAEGPVLTALWELLRAEGATFAASTLAGLTQDRPYGEGDSLALA